MRISLKGDIEPGNLYGIPHGVYRGELFCFIESVNGTHYFLSIPKMEYRSVPIEKFDIAIKDSIIDFIEKLPNDVYQVVEAQYKKCRTINI